MGQTCAPNPTGASVRPAVGRAGRILTQPAQIHHERALPPSGPARNVAAVPSPRSLTPELPLVRSTSWPPRRLSWSLVLLIASLCAVGLAAYQAVRSARKQREIAEHLLRDYAAFATWSYQRQASDALLEAAFQTVGPILHREMHTFPGYPDAFDLVRYREQSLKECGCDPAARPGTYFSYVLGTDTLATVGVPLAAGARRWIQDTLVRRHRGAETTDRLAIIAGGAGDPVTLFAYGLMPTSRGDTMVYGFTFDPASLRQVFADAFTGTALLPEAVTRGIANDSLLAVRVENRAGEALYMSTDEADWSRSATDLLRASSGLRVTATVRSVLAANVLGTGRRAPILLAVVLVIAVALTLVAVRQLRRESELVDLRSGFVASVSHELRTPLAQIRLFLETLRLGRFETDQQRDWLLGHLDRETLRLTHLVENVLHFSRTRRQATPPPLEPTDVGAEIEETVRAFAPLALPRQVAVVTDLGEGLVVPLDRSRFRQMLLNLLDNAVKYGPAGQTVTVRAERAGGVVRVSVADQGPGVESGERERIWEPYYRGRGSAVRAVGGSGIGLAVVREAVERHGGRATLDAAPGPGATIMIELPA